MHHTPCLIPASIALAKRAPLSLLQALPALHMHYLLRATRLISAEHTLIHKAVQPLEGRGPPRLI